LINIDKSGANTAAIKQYNCDENKRVKGVVKLSV
jgi:hypothetical protein